jgi:hypothetical protein
MERQDEKPLGPGWKYAIGMIMVCVVLGGVVLLMCWGVAVR